MENINIKEISKTDSAWEFEVVVSEGSASTKHRVTVNKKDSQELAPKHSPQELVWASFLFLLEREPKEVILESFNLMLIAKYFPEYKKKIKDYL